jgi:hypothetical protein
MYRKFLNLPASLFTTNHATLTSTLSSPPGLLARLFILAEKYQLAPLQNDIIDALLLWLNDFNLSLRIPARVIQYVWENTVSECKLRQFLLDYVRAQWTFFDVRREEVRDGIEGDFWYALSRDLVLTLDCLRDRVEEGKGGGSLVEELVEELVVDDLRCDVCVRWHRHDDEKEEGRCEVLKKYVLDDEGDKDR